DIPFAPRRDDLQLRCEGFVCELESYLIVAFTRTSMRDSVCFLLNCNFDLSFCEKRPCDRCPQQILAFVHRAGSDKRPEVLSYEFVPKVLDVALGRATANSLFFQPLELIILADVPGHGNDFTAIVFLEPRNDDRRIQAARIRQN